MIVELFGIARLRGGVSRREFDANTLGEALTLLAASLPELSGSVVIGDKVHPSHKISLNGERFLTDPETSLAPSDHILIISADAGG